MKEFLHFLKKYKHEFVFLLLVSSLLYMVEGFVHPILLKIIFDEAIVKGNFHKFLKLVLAYLGLGFFLNAWGFCVSLWIKSLKNRVFKRTTGQMLSAYYNKDYSTILQKGEGYFLSRIYNDVSEGLLPYMDVIMGMFTNGARIIALFGAVFYISWRLSLILLVVIPFTAYISHVLGQKIKNITILEREGEGALLNVLNRLISAFKIIRTFSLIPEMTKVYDKEADGYLKINYENYKLMQMLESSISVVRNISDTISLTVGGYFVLIGRLTFGGYIAYINAFWRAVTTLMGLIKPIGSLQRYLQILKRLFEFEKERQKKYFKKGEAIMLKAVDFSFNHKPILKDFNLKIEKGEKVVIVGPNGSGKTTLANIISGHLAPQHGEVVLPKRISSVTLPIAFPPIKVKELVKDKNLLKVFVLEDLLEKNAEDLSMGQKQKLAIIKAISKNADLYVFDEPFSNIDKESVQKVMEKIFERTIGETLVFVLHGFEKFYPHFDRIIKLENRK